MKAGKRLIVAVLSLMILLTSGAMAQGTSGGTLSLSSGEAAPGEEVTLTLTMANNPGIVSMQVDVGYDAEVMTLTKVENKGILSGADFDTNNLDGNPYRLSWANDTAPENLTATGDLVTLTFQVKEGAAKGSYPVTLTEVPESIYDFDMETVNFQLQGGAVTVTGPALSGSLSISGLMKVKEIITAAATGVQEDAELDYSWYRENEEESIGSGENYTLTLADLGKLIQVRAMEKNGTYSGAIASEAAGPVEKADAAGETVAAEVSVTTDTVTVSNVTEGQEYSIDNGETWSDDGVFTGLTPSTDYTVLTRLKETEDTKAGATVETGARTEDPAPPVPVEQGSLSLSSGEAAPGQEVSLTLSMADNPGIIGMQVDVGYDANVMTLTKVEDKGILSGAKHNTEDLSGNPYRLSWVNENAAEDLTVNGDLVTLTFTVKDDAAEGDYPVTLTLVENETINFNVQKVDFQVQDGAVTVKPENTPLSGSLSISGLMKVKEIITAAATGVQEDAELEYSWYRDGEEEAISSGENYELTLADLGKLIQARAMDKSGKYSGELASQSAGPVEAAAESGSLSLSSAAAAPGEEVSLTLTLADNPGIIGMQLDVSYDANVMTLTKVEDKSTLSGFDSDPSNLGSNPYRLSWANDTAPSNLTDNGDLTALTFTVKEDAADGEYPVTLELVPNSAFNFDLEYVNFQLQNGAVTVGTTVQALTGTPVITGEPVFGQTLTADLSGMNNAGSETAAYQWKRGEDSIENGTDASYTLTEDDIGKEITVTVTDERFTGSADSEAAGPVEKAEAAGEAEKAELTPTADTLTVTNVKDGQEYSIDGTNWNIDGIFQGLTPNTDYTVQTRLKETTTHKAGAPVETKTKTTEAEKPGLTGKPEIKGDPVFDQTLTADISGMNNAGSETADYQWKRGADSIENGTDASYTLTADDIGKEITVTVTDENYSGSADSAAVGPVEKAEAAGEPEEAQVTPTADTLTVTNPQEGHEYSIDGTTWNEDGKFTGLTPNTDYTVQTRLKETTTHKAGAPVETKIKTTEAGENALTGKPEIKGDPVVGQTLTADLSKMNNADSATASYQWNRDEQPIQGATEKTYVLTQDDVDKKISVTVKDTAYSGNATSENIGPVTKPQPPEKGKLVLSSGEAAPGEEVSLTLTMSDNPGIIGMQLDVAYDANVMTLTKVEDKGTLNGAKHNTEDLSGNPYRLSWINENAAEDLTVNGDLVTLTFTVKENGAKGDYPVKLTLIKDETINYDVQKVDFQLQDGSVTVKAVKAPYTGEGPVVPDLDSTADTVTVKTVVDGQEYSIDNGETWTDDGIFTGLKPNQKYTVITRVKETETVQASSVVSAEISTKKKDQTLTVPEKEELPAPGTLDLTSLCSSDAVGAVRTYEISGEAPVGVTLKDGVLTATSEAVIGTKFDVVVSASETEDYLAAQSKTIPVTVVERQGKDVFVFDAAFNEAVTKTYGDEAFTKAAKLTNGDGTISYTSSDEKVATVDENGQVTILAAGTTTITATAAETEQFRSAEISYTLTVEKRALTISAGNINAVVGDAVPELDPKNYTVIGLVGDDKLTKEPVLSYAKDPDMSQPGMVAIHITGAEADDNYAISYQEGVLLIREKEAGVSVTVLVNWDDQSDAAKVRPESVQVQLYKDGKPEGEPVELKANEAGEWTHTWTGLDKSAVYTVDQVDSETLTKAGYEKDFDPDRNKTEVRVEGEVVRTVFTITNRKKAEITNVKSITVRKDWQDSNDLAKKRPDSVRMQLQVKDGAVFKNSGEVVTLNQANKWSYTWSDLDVSKTYTVVEVGIPDGYSAKGNPPIPMEAGVNGVVLSITNTYQQPVVNTWSIAVAKTANGSVTASAEKAVQGTEVTLTATPEKGYALKSVTVTGKDGTAVKLTENKNGTYSFTMPDMDVTVSAVFEEQSAQTKESPVFADGFTAPAGKTYGDAPFTLTARLTKGDGAITYRSSNEKVATVDKNGLVTIRGAGEATITAVSAETEKFAAGEVSTVLKVARKTLTIRPRNKTAMVDDPVPTLGAGDYQVDGLVGSDTLIKAPELSYVMEPGTGKVGTVAIRAANADAGENYTIKYEDGTLTIRAKDNNDNGGSGSGGGKTTPVPSVYKVTVAKVENGIVRVDPMNAAAGSMVTMEPIGNDGQVLDSIKVLDKDGKGVLVLRGEGDLYAFTMPESDVTVEAVFGHQCMAKDFKDVNLDAWYHESIDYVLIHGLMNGVFYDTFAPDATLTRAMVVTTLHRLEGTPAVTRTNRFVDVPSDTWYTDAVEWAASKGIVYGIGRDRYDPDTPITREQMATILFRYSQVKGYDMSGRKELTPFVDGNKVSEYAIEPMSWAFANGYITGTSGTTMEPQGHTTRAQTATILMRLGLALDK